MAAFDDTITLNNGKLCIIASYKGSKNVFLLTEIKEKLQFILRKTEGVNEKYSKDIETLKSKQNDMKLLSYHHHEIKLEKGKQWLYLIMEHAATGGSLADLRNLRRQESNKEGCLDEEEVAIYIIQVLDALSYIHKEKSLCHGNIRPQSVILFNNRKIKLSWPKISKPNAHKMEDKDPYIPPEMLLGKKADAKADIWAVGCLTYELLIGRCKDTTEMQKKSSSVRKKNNLPDFISSCIQQSKDNRLPSKKLKESEWFETWRSKAWDQLQEKMNTDEDRTEYISSIWMLFKDTKWQSSSNTKTIGTSSAKKKSSDKVTAMAACKPAKVPKSPKRKLPAFNCDTSNFGSTLLSAPPMFSDVDTGPSTTKTIKKEPQPQEREAVREANRMENFSTSSASTVEINNTPRTVQTEPEDEQPQTIADLMKSWFK